MTKRDVILTCYACTASAPCTKWAKELFGEEPLVISVPGSGDTFTRKGRQWVATGDAFRSALNELAPQYRGLEIGRRALITFDQGWLFGNEILRSARERHLLDAYLVEDGLHSSDLDHWVEYSKNAARSEAWMLLAHTRINPSRDFNYDVFRRAKEANDQDLEASKLANKAPGYMTHPGVPTDGIKITVGATRNHEGRVIVPAHTKVWDMDPLLAWENRGNLWRFEYDGISRADHLYILQEAGYRCWKMLAEHWS